MIHAQTSKTLVITPPAAKVDDASFTTASIDTKGWDYLEVLCIFGDIDVNMVALSLGQSDTDGSYAALLTYGTSTDIDGSTSALPTAAGADNDIFAFEVDLRGKKRYFDVTATGGDGTAGTFMTVIARLTRGSTAATSLAERGYVGCLRA